MKYIKLYENFISEELRKVISKSSGSGRTREVDLVYDDPQDAKSLSAGVLLKNDLRDQEFKDMIDRFGTNVPDWKVKAYIKKSSPANKTDKFKVTMNNLRFLKDKAKEGELRCEYCNKGPLLIYDIEYDGSDKKRRRVSNFRTSDGATCDHKQPQSKGGDKFDYSNLVVCCHRCNMLKGDMSYSEWIEFMERNSHKSGGWANFIKKLKSIS